MSRDFVSSQTSIHAFENYFSTSICLFFFFFELLLFILAGSFRLDISKSFGRKKGSRPKPPKDVDGGRYSSTVPSEPLSLNSRISPKKKVESINGGHISPAKRFYSEEIHPEDPSLNVEQHDTPRIPSYDSLMMVRLFFLPP